MEAGEMENLPHLVGEPGENQAAGPGLDLLGDHENAAQAGAADVFQAIELNDKVRGLRGGGLGEGLVEEGRRDGVHTPLEFDDPDGALLTVGNIQLLTPGWGLP